MPTRAVPNHHAPRTATLTVWGKATLTVATIGVAMFSWSLMHPALASQPPEPPLTTVMDAAARPIVATVSSPAASSGPTVSTAPPHAPQSRPVSLQIPRLGLNSPLAVLGQTVTGAVQVPLPGPGYDQPGWYRFSPTPGSVGPAVIVGHVDSAAAGVSVFYRLGELQPGDHASVVLANGRVALFRVYAVRRYTKAAFPSATVYGNTADAELRLITCSGAFDRDTGHYLDNTIAFASLVNDPVAPGGTIAR